MNNYRCIKPELFVVAFNVKLCTQPTCQIFPTLQLGSEGGVGWGVVGGGNTLRLFQVLAVVIRPPRVSATSPTLESST
jgi:hypothetical protein